MRIRPVVHVEERTPYRRKRFSKSNRARIFVDYPRKRKSYVSHAVFGRSFARSGTKLWTYARECNRRRSIKTSRVRVERFRSFRTKPSEDNASSTTDEYTPPPGPHRVQWRRNHVEYTVDAPDRSDTVKKYPFEFASASAYGTRAVRLSALPDVWATTTNE